MDPQIYWYVSRATGLVAWVLLVGSMVLGVLLATRVLKPNDRPAWLLAMHRWLSAMVVILTAVHLLALVADSYVHFSWAELLVPGASPWKTGAVGIGVVALYLLAAVQLTSLMMKRLPRRLWKGIHLSSYVMVWAASMHAGLAGTDVTNPVYQAVALGLLIAAISATMVRVLLPSTARRARPAGSAERPARASSRAASPTPVDRLAPPSGDPVLLEPPVGVG